MRKNRISVLLFFSFFVILWSSCERKEIKNIDSQGENIICFGNSITAGYGVDRSESYPYLLEKLISLPVINAGLNGDITSEALKRLKSDVLDREPYLVIIELGGNDFLKGIPLRETIKNMEEIILKIQSQGAMVALVDISSGIVMSNYHREYKFLSKKYKTIFIPHLLSGILTDPGLKTDFIHPNPQGHRLIAERVYRAILPFIKKYAKN